MKLKELRATIELFIEEWGPQSLDFDLYLDDTFGTELMACNEDMTTSIIEFLDDEHTI